MPTDLHHNPFLKILIQNHSITNYFRNLIVQYVLKDQRIKKDVVKIIKPLSMTNQPIPFASINKQITIKHAKILNQKLNQYLNNWSHVLFHHPEGDHDFENVLFDLLAQLNYPNERKLFQTYQPYQQQTFNQAVQLYFTIGENLEQSMIKTAQQ